ncbi:unnamed protein product [Musa acuminata subsp. burmannicoides]
MGSAKGSPVRPSSGVLLASDGSFSALLSLPSDQAVNLLHRLPDPNAVASSGEMRRLCLPPRPKAELLDSAGLRLIAQRSAKRKEGEKRRGESPAKKSKRRSEEGTACGKKLPCVHVRARRGQATDSHSLAERARREKINARMKVLRELVPGCSKISGTTLLLDEIINHIKSLQCLIELLSMRLAAANSRISFSGPDSSSSVDCGWLTVNNERSRRVGMEPIEWSSYGGRRQPQQHIWHINLVHPQQTSRASEGETPTTPIMGPYSSSAINLLLVTAALLFHLFMSQTKLKDYNTLDKGLVRR